jgi:AhpD family alkylhydroperoxidase
VLDPGRSDVMTEAVTTGVWPVYPNRIAPVTDPDEAQGNALAKTPVLPNGQVRNIFTTLAWQPVLLQRFNAMAGTFMRFSTLTAAVRELVVLRVAATIRCRYELGQHLPLAREAGLSDDTIRAVLDVPAVTGLAPDEVLLAQLTDQVLARGEVGDATWTRLRAQYAEPQLIELLALIGQYRMIGDLLNITGVQLESDMSAEVERWMRSS